MSHGSLNLGKGEYKSLSDNGEIVRHDDFRNTPYFTDTIVLTRDFGIPESAIPRLNAIIGNFLIAIQEASYVYREVLDVVPPIPFHRRGEGDAYQEIPLARASTLSANLLTIIIRQKIEGVVRDILALKPELDLKKSEMRKNTIYSKNETLSFSTMTRHDCEIDNADLLPKEARDVIEQFYPGSSETVNEIARNIAVNILHRADLSFASLRHNVTKLHGKLDHRERMAQYATLNPVDLLNMAKRDFKHIPAGISSGYSKEEWEKLFERLRDPAERDSL